MSGNHILLDTSIEKVGKSMAAIIQKIAPKKLEDYPDKELFKLLAPVYKNIEDAMKVAWAHALTTNDYTGVAKAAAAALYVFPMGKEPSEMQIKILDGFKQYIRGYAPLGTDRVLRFGIDNLPGDRAVKDIVKGAFVNTSPDPKEQTNNIIALYQWMHSALQAENKRHSSIDTDASTPTPSRTPTPTPSQLSLRELAESQDNERGKKPEVSDEEDDNSIYYDTLGPEEKQELKSFFEMVKDALKDTKPAFIQAMQTVSDNLDKALDRISRHM